MSTSIRKMITKFGDALVPVADFVELQTDFIRKMKEIVKIAQEDHLVSNFRLMMPTSRYIYLAK